MIGCTTWSYAPYKPFFFETGDIYICRLAPSRTGIHCEWLGDAGVRYDVMLRIEGRGEFRRAATVAVPETTIDGLAPETDYELYVRAGEK